MVYIQKRRTSDIVKQKAVEVIKTPDSGYSSINLPQDTKKLRGLFDKMPKKMK